MKTFVGTSGYIPCPNSMGIEVRGVLSTESVTLSGLWTSYIFDYSEKVEGVFRFAANEDVNIDSAAQVVVNYILYGDQTAYMQGPDRAGAPGKRLMPGKWDVS